MVASFHITGSKLRDLQAPTLELPVLDNAEKTFSNRNKLFIGNLKTGLTEAELKEMLLEFGEVDDLFYNPAKHFCFLKYDYRANAERCKSRLDGKDAGGGRNIKVRFAPSQAVIKVKNLGPKVSNELLHRAFSIFGPVERALVMVEGERAHSKGEGIVEFLNRRSAQEALIACEEGHFVLTKTVVPVVVEPYEALDTEDGLPDTELSRRDEQFQYEREVGPRFIDPGSFEAKFCEKFKALTALRKEKEAALDREMKLEEEKLWAQMDFVRHQHETEMLREQLRIREEEREHSMKLMAEREAEVQRRLELEREEQRRREAMFNFSLSGADNSMAQMMGMGEISPMGGNMMSMMMEGDDMMMAESPRMGLNPAVWAEFSPGEGGGKRPRFPAEVFGRGSSGGGGSSSSKGRSRFSRSAAD